MLYPPPAGCAHRDHESRGGGLRDDIIPGRLSLRQYPSDDDRGTFPPSPPTIRSSLTCSQDPTAGAKSRIKRRINDMDKVYPSTFLPSLKTNTSRSVWRITLYRVRNVLSCSMSFAKRAADDACYQSPCISRIVRMIPWRLGAGALRTYRRVHTKGAG